MFRSLFVLILVISAFHFLPSTLNAQDCFQGWTRRTPITVSNAANTADAVEVQVRLEVNTAALVATGQMQPDGEDIRLVADDNCCVPLCFWIESGMNTASTVIWVKVPYVPAGGAATVVMLHGNPTVSVAGWSGDCTFDFFDDFLSVFDTTKWAVRGTPSTLTVAGSYLTFAGGSNWEYVRSKPTFSYPVGIHWKGRASSPPSAGAVIGFQGGDNRYTFRLNGANLGTTQDNDVASGNVWEDSNYPAIPGASMADNVFEVRSALSMSGKVQISSFCNQTLGSCNTSSKTLNAFTGSAVFVGFSSYDAGYVGDWDYLFVRRRMPTDLSASLGVSSAHVAPSLADTTGFCEGDSVEINPGAGYLSYSWGTGATTPSVWVATEGLLGYTLTDSVCTYVDSLWVAEWDSPEVEQEEDTLWLCAGTFGWLSVERDSGTTLLWSTSDTLDSVWVSLPGSYTATVTDGAGCTASASAWVENQPLPNASISASPALTVCAGTPVDLSAAAGMVSYLWSTSAGTPGITVTDAGPYAVAVVDSNGCTGTDTVEVVHLPLPVPPIYDMFSFFATDPGYASYQWLLDGSPLAGETTEMVFPIAPGFYSVQVTDSNGCVGTSDSLEYIITSVAGAAAPALGIFPNPTQGAFALQAQGITGERVQVQIMDITGRVRFSAELVPQGNALTLHLDAELEAGQVYLVVLRQGDLRLTQRLAVQ